MDTTYWGRNFGVVIIKDAIKGRVLWFKFIDRKERVPDYEEGIGFIERQGTIIRGIVSDGFKGLRNKLARYLFQHCQFHAVQYVKLKLTSHPQSEAARQLLDIALILTKTDKPSFVGAFEDWESKWKAYIDERTTDPNGRKRYTHQRLRSAWRNLKTNMQWLWTFYDNPDSGIPNTNNDLEGLNSSLKDHMRRHRGISIEKRKVVISESLNAHNPKHIK